MQFASDRALGLVRLRTVAIVVVALGLLGAPAAQAITRADAIRIALRTLRPQAQRAAVGVFALPRPLASGHYVYESGRAGKHRVKPLKHAAWVFWEDLAVGANFAHSSTLLLLDAGTGRVIQRQSMHWFPYVDHQLAPFLRTAAAYRSHKYVVYPAARRHRRSSRTAGADRRRAVAAAYAPATNRHDALKNDCLVTIGDFFSPNFKGDLTAMQGFADAVGLKQENVYPATIPGLKNKVKTFIDGGCTDVLVFIAGHGRPPAEYWEGGVRKHGGVDTGPPGVLINQQEKFKHGELFNNSGYITPKTLISLVKPYPEIDFKFKLDSCFAGRFESVFRDAPNVVALEASAAADEVGYTTALKPNDSYPVADPVTHKFTKQTRSDDTDNPDGASTFVNANVHAFMEWGATAPADGTLLDAITHVWTANDGFDFAVNVNYTHPMRLIDPRKARHRNLLTPRYFQNPFPGVTGFGPGSSSLDGSAVLAIGNTAGGQDVVAFDAQAGGADTAIGGGNGEFAVPTDPSLNYQGWVKAIGDANVITTFGFTATGDLVAHNWSLAGASLSSSTISGNGAYFNGSQVGVFPTPSAINVFYLNTDAASHKGVVGSVSWHAGTISPWPVPTPTYLGAAGGGAGAFIPFSIAWDPSNGYTLAGVTNTFANTAIFSLDNAGANPLGPVVVGPHGGQGEPRVKFDPLSGRFYIYTSVSLPGNDEGPQVSSVDRSGNVSPGFTTFTGQPATQYFPDGLFRRGTNLLAFGNAGGTPVVTVLDAATGAPNSAAGANGTATFPAPGAMFSYGQSVEQAGLSYVWFQNASTGPVVIELSSFP